jgi:tricorn protease
VFDKSGKYLLLHRQHEPRSDDKFSRSVPGSITRTSRNVYAIVLRNDIPSPLAPESDEEKIAPEKKDEPKPSITQSPTPSVAATATPAPKLFARCSAESSRQHQLRQRRNLRSRRAWILEGIDQRVIAISQIPARNYSELHVGKAGTLYCD